MKISVASILAVLTTLPAIGAEAPPSKLAAMRDVATHDQIVEAARKAREENPMPVFQPVEGADPTVITRPQSLIARSEILTFQGKATLVPKRAVIHIPKEVSDRLGMKDGHQIGSWLDFLNANRAWIRTVPVTRAQAEGREPMGEDTIKSFEKEKRLVVATYQDGPISVMPLKVPPPVEPAVPGAPAVSGAPAAPATATASTTTNVSQP